MRSWIKQHKAWAAIVIFLGILVVAFLAYHGVSDGITSP
jgi:hypothetical protein